MFVVFTGYGYPYASDSLNIADDDDDDEILTSATSDSINKLTSTVYATYNPTAVQQPDWAPAQQNIPSGPEVERLIHDVPRVWGLEDPQKPQLGPVQPQSTLLGDSTYASPTIYYAPSTSQAANSPSAESWQPDSSGYSMVDLNTDSSAAGNTNHLVYEDVFHYPSKSAEPPQSYGSISNAAGGSGQSNLESQESSTRGASAFGTHSFPRYPTNAGAWLVSPARMESFHRGVNFNFGHTGYRPHDGVSLHPQKAAKTQKVEVSQRVHDPIFPPAPPPSYIVQSRNGYQQGRHVLSHTRYSPEFNAPMPINSKGGEGPAPSRPAAPKGVKDSQRYSYQKFSL